MAWKRESEPRRVRPSRGALSRHQAWWGRYAGRLYENASGPVRRGDIGNRNEMRMKENRDGR